MPPRENDGVLTRCSKGVPYDIFVTKGLPNALAWVPLSDVESSWGPKDWVEAVEEQVDEGSALIESGREK